MEDKTVAFNNLSMLIEDTEILIKGLWFNNYDEKSFFTGVNEYFIKYEYKPTIVKGITSAVGFTKLLESKHKHLKTLLDELNELSKKIIIKEVLKDDEFFFNFSIKSVIDNRLVPLLEFVIYEIELSFDHLDRPQIETNNSIEWKGTKTELSALIKSLIESKKFDTSLTEVKIVKNFEKFFKVDLKTYNQTNTKIRNRTKDFTPFIDKLKINLENWIKRKDS